MAAHPNPILNPEPSRPPNRRDLLRSAAAATLGLAASGLDPSASAGEILDSVRQSAARIHSEPPNSRMFAW